MKRMWKALVAAVFGVAVLVLGLAAPAEAQLAKSGKFTAQFNWHFQGTNNELGEKYSSAFGQAWGVVNNSAGSGFLHNAGSRCASLNVAKEGKANDAGGCVLWDADGDAVVLDYSCASDSDGWCKGTFEWTGGTGKYSGISGKTKFRHRAVTYRGTGGPNGEGEGYSLWEGEYRLP